MNIYSAKSLITNKVIEGQYTNFTCPMITHWVDFYEWIPEQIDPSTLEVVKLDFTDTQKKILIQNGKYVLRDLMTDLSELINVYTRITFWNGKDFEDKEEFSKLVERVLLLHIEIILEKIKKASQLLKGI